MNYNRTSKTILGISVAAVLAVSVFSVIGIQEADADGFKGLKGLLKKTKNNNPHFETQLTNAATVPLVPDKGFSGNAKAWLIYEDGEIKLKYRIKTNMDLNAGWPLTASDVDDITKIHLHNNVPGVAGPHVLNVYKAPAQDDADLVVKPLKGVVKGIWDNGDANDLAPAGPSHNDSFVFTEVNPLNNKILLAELCEGNIYANVHGTGDQGPGALRGNFEATDRGEKICNFLEKKGVI